MNVLDKLFNREPEVEPMEDPNLKKIAEMQGKLSTQDRALLDDYVYLRNSQNKIAQVPQGESLAFINPMEEQILRNSGVSLPSMSACGIPSYAPDYPL